MSFFAKTLEFLNDSEDTTGVYYLERQAYLYYDFTRLTGTTGSSISNGNAGLVDYSGNGHTATIVGTPQVLDYTLNAEVIKTLRDTGTEAVNTNTPGADFLNGDFTVYILFQSSDGQIAATYNLLGGIHPTNIGLNVFVNTSGNVGLVYANSSGSFTLLTNTAPINNGLTNPILLRFSISFSTDTASVYKNGVLQTSSFSAGTIVGIDPTLSSTEFTTDIYIGTLNNNGTPGTNSNTNSIFSVAITPLDVGPTYIEEAMMSITWKDWEEKEVHVTAANVATERATAISNLYNGGSLPTITPTVTTGISGAIHICNTSNITHASSWDRLTFDTTDVDGFTWSHKCYLGHTDETPNGKLIIVNNGHASDVASGYEALMSIALARGYDVLYTAMPVVGDNTETNPTITSTSSTGHNQILSGGLDRVGYNPLGLFLFDKFSAINYLDASYSEIIVNGNSGGGWTSCWLGALDERVTYTFCNRGVKLRSFKWNETSIDYEQGGMPGFTWDSALAGTTTSGTRLYAHYTTTTYFDLLAMCASSGRKVYTLTHATDTCCFIGTVSWVWMDTLKSLCGQMGGEYHNRIDFNSSRATHGFSQKDIDDMFHALGDL